MAQSLAADMVTKPARQFAMEPLSLSNRTRNSLITPKGDLAVCSIEVKEIFSNWKAQKEGKKKNPTKQNPPQQPRNPCTSYTWGRKRLSYLKGPSVLHRPYSPTLWVMTGQELTEQMCTFLFLWVFKRYMPACTHLHFWGFQSSNSVIWDLRTVLKIISQLSLHVLIDHS